MAKPDSKKVLIRRPRFLLLSFHFAIPIRERQVMFVLNGRFARDFPRIHLRNLEAFRDFEIRWLDRDQPPAYAELPGSALAAFRRQLRTGKNIPAARRFRTNVDPTYAFVFDEFRADPDIKFLDLVWQFIQSERRRMQFLPQKWLLPNFSDFKNADLAIPVICRGTFLNANISKTPVRFEAIFNSVNGQPYPLVNSPTSKHLGGIWNCLLDVLGIEFACALWDAKIWTVPGATPETPIRAEETHGPVNVNGDDARDPPPE